VARFLAGRETLKLQDEQQVATLDQTCLGGTKLCLVGGIAACLLIVYCVATMVQLIVLGGPPTTAAEAFRLLQSHRIVGLLRLDLPTMLVLPLYYLLYLGLLAALRRADFTNALLSTVLAFVGVTLSLATPSALSMLWLSQRHTAATTEAMRAQLEAAGEAILASDIWHGTGSVLGGALAQSGAVLICVVMLRSRVFGKVTACLGILMHGLDLAHIVLGPFVPVAGVALMAIAGPVYPIWFFLVGRRLLLLASDAGPGESRAGGRSLPQSPN
jgi:hypothetical protein